MPLSLEQEGGDGKALPVEFVRHQLGLVRRDHAVVEALEEDDRAAEPRGVVEGRAGAVHVALGGPLADQPIEVTGLELVGVGRKDFEVADAVVAGASPEHVVEGEGGEGGVAARAAAADREPGRIRAAGIGEVPRARDAILDIDHPPLAVEPLAIRAPVGRCCPGSRRRGPAKPRLVQNWIEGLRVSAVAPVGPPWLKTRSGGDSPAGVRHGRDCAARRNSRARSRCRRRSER